MRTRSLDQMMCTASVVKTLEERGGGGGEEIFYSRFLELCVYKAHSCTGMQPVCLSFDVDGA